MNVLDEDIIAPEHERLRSRGVHFRAIGIDVGWLGMKDIDDIIPLLHGLRRPTFFTQDHGFYRPALRHPGYCLVYLDVFPDEAAEYIRRFLRHKDFRTVAKRMGLVVRVRPGGVSFWRADAENEQSIAWKR